MKNYYHILGLSLDSNPDAELISQCHKALIKIFHPDVFKGDKKLGEKKVREINEAYEVLRDKKKRKKYDEDLKNYLNQQNKSSGTTDNPKQNNYKTDKDFNDTDFDNQSSEESRKENPWAVLAPLVFLIFIIVRWLSDDDSEEKVVSSPSSNNVQEYIQSEPVIEKNKTINYDNGVYVGGVLNGKRHGYGVYKWKEGGMYEGNWKNHKKHGYGVMTWNNGDKYEGNWKNNKKHGYGVNTWPSGAKYEGNYQNGIKSGKGTYYYSNGDKYIGDWQNNAFHGQGKFIYNDGTSYEGGWKNDKKNGYGKQYFNNGVYEGNHSNDKQNGQGTYRFFDSGNKYIGSFKNDQFHGYGKFIDKYGILFQEGIYENGKKK